MLTDGGKYINARVLLDGEDVTHRTRCVCVDESWVELVRVDDDGRTPVREVEPGLFLARVERRRGVVELRAPGDLGNN